MDIPLGAKINVEIEADATSVANATADAITTVVKGAAKIIHAWAGPWMANQKRTAALIEAQMVRDCAAVKSGAMSFRGGELLACDGFSSELEMCDQLHKLNHMADALRLKAAVDLAIAELRKINPKDISDEPLSQTFFNRWRREAEMIDDDYLRRWWARLLKEEVVESNRISAQTLDVVKDLSRVDCERFVDLCRGVVCDELIVSYDNQSAFCSYDEIAEMQNLRLISHLPAAAKVKRVGGSDALVIRFNGSAYGLILRDAGLYVHTFSLTRAGSDLLRVVGRPRMSEADVRRIGDFINEHALDGKGVKVTDLSSMPKCDNWTWGRGHRPACWE